MAKKPTSINHYTTTASRQSCQEQHEYPSRLRRFVIHYNKLLARNAYTKTDKYRKNGDISLIDHLLSIAKKDTHQPKAQFEMINTWDDG